MISLEIKNLDQKFNSPRSKFDEKYDKMGLYFINFERRAEMALVMKKDWVTYLLAILPREITNMLAREPASDANKTLLKIL